MSVFGIVKAFGMKAVGEEKYEFLPDYALSWCDHGQLLKEPKEYGLDGFEPIKEDWSEEDEIPKDGLHLQGGGFVTAWYKPPKPGYATVVYCHGNAGSLDMRRHQLTALSDLGLGVIIAAYPGFKGHVERYAPPSEEGCYRASQAMVSIWW